VSPKLAWVLDQVWAAEGGVANHKDDPGGLTNRYGITWQLAERYGHSTPIGMTRFDAEHIVMAEWWEPMGLELVSSKYIAHELMDSAYNMGTSAAVKIAQRAVNMIAAQAGGEALIIDGRIGPKTIRALNHLVDKGYEKQLYHCMNGFQFVRYLEIYSRGPWASSFIAGWMMRLARFPEMLP